MQVTVAATQFACTPNPAENLDKAEALVREAAGRGAQLTRQLLAFSRHGSGEPAAPQDAAAVIGEMLGLLSRLLGTGVRVVPDLAPGVRIMAPPGQLEQVVLNLAVNARDAMEGHGTLRIALHAHEVLAPELVREVGGSRLAVGCRTVTSDAEVAKVLEGFTPDQLIEVEPLWDTPTGQKSEVMINMRPQRATLVVYCA